MREHLQLEQFEVTVEFGRGGMGSVYQAYDHVLQRDVTVKIHFSRSLGNPLDEARLLEQRGRLRLRGGQFEPGQVDLGAAADLYRTIGGVADLEHLTTYLDQGDDG